MDGRFLCVIFEGVECIIYIALHLEMFTNLISVYVAGQIEPSGQFVSTQVSLGQVQNPGHRSLFHQYRKYPKHLSMLTLGLTRPKEKLLGLMLPLVNG